MMIETRAFLEKIAGVKDPDVMMLADWLIRIEHERKQPGNVAAETQVALDAWTHVFIGMGLSRYSSEFLRRLTMRANPIANVRPGKKVD